MKFFLHIGFGKTGTTSIQDYLFNNKERYASVYCYPEVGLRGSGQHNLAPLGKESFEAEDSIRYTKLVKFLSTTKKSPTTIISSEYFCFAKQGFIKDIHRFLQEFDVRIIFYVRNQIDLIQSAFLQWQREGWDYQGSLESYFKAHGHAFDFMSRIEPWADCFGADNIIARVYDKKVTGKDVCFDFLKLIGLEHCCSVDFLPRSNESLIPEFSSLITNMDESGIGPDERKELIRFLLEASVNFKKFSRSSLVSSRMRRVIQEYYLDSNRYFAKSFLDEFQADVFLKGMISEIEK